MPATVYWVSEVSRWFAIGLGVCGIGATRSEALQNWREDVRRTELERAARIAAITEGK